MVVGMPCLYVPQMKLNLKNGVEVPMVFQTVTAIVDRAIKMIPDLDRTSFALALMGTHLEVPLNLDVFLIASDANFIHDVTGIMKYFSSITGKLECGFTPRFASHQ